MDSTKDTLDDSAIARIARATKIKTAQNADWPLELLVKIDSTKGSGQYQVSNYVILEIDGGPETWTLGFQHPGFIGPHGINLRAEIPMAELTQLASTGKLRVTGKAAAYSAVCTINLTMKDIGELQVWMDERLSSL